MGGEWEIVKEGNRGLTDQVPVLVQLLVDVSATLGELAGQGCRGLCMSSVFAFSFVPYGVPLPAQVISIAFFWHQRHSVIWRGWARIWHCPSCPIIVPPALSSLHFGLSASRVAAASKLASKLWNPGSNMKLFMLPIVPAGCPGRHNCPELPYGQIGSKEKWWCNRKVSASHKGEDIHQLPAGVWRWMILSSNSNGPKKTAAFCKHF